MALTINTIRQQLLTTIFGGRLGLDQRDYIGGVNAVRRPIEDITTTSPTTAAAHGITRISGLGSSQGPVQHNLPVPVPGVEKTLILDCTSTGSQQFLSTPNGASIVASSLGTTVGVINFVGPGGRITLIGVSTAQWSVMGEGLYASTALAKQISFTTST